MIAVFRIVVAYWIIRAKICCDVACPSLLFSIYRMLIELKTN